MVFRRSLGFFPLLAILLALQGCATTTPSVPDDYRLTDGDETGLLICSLTYRGSYSGYSVMFESADGTQSKWIQTGQGIALIPIAPKGDFDAFGLHGDLFAIEISAGQYAFKSWLVESGYATVKPTSSFTINFEIRSGKALYIGNFGFRQTASYGLTVTGVELAYGDEFERDMKLFRTKYENVAPGRIYKGIEDGLVVDKLGGADHTDWNMPIIVPVY